MSDFWQQIESGKDRRRRLAFERSLQQKSSNDSSNIKDETANISAVETVLGKRGKSQKKHAMHGLNNKSVSSGQTLINLNDADSVIDQQCVASLSKVITNVIKQSADTVNDQQIDTNVKHPKRETETASRARVVTNTDRLCEGQISNTGTRCQADSNNKKEDVTLVHNKIQTCESERGFHVNAGSMSAKTNPAQPLQNAKSYAAIVLKHRNTKCKETTELKETDDSVRDQQTDENSGILSQSLADSVWFNKSEYNEAERNLYVNSSKKNEPITEADEEDRASQTIPCFSNSGVWMERSSFNDVEKSFYENNQQRLNEQSDSVSGALNSRVKEFDSITQSPPSLTFELDDMYYEDMILPGRESDVTMEYTHGFTATELNESLLPDERMDSLQMEPELDRMMELNPDSLVQVSNTYATIAAGKSASFNSREHENVLYTQEADNDTYTDKHSAIEKDTLTSKNTSSTTEKVLMPTLSSKPEILPENNAGRKTTESKRKRSGRKRSGSHCESGENRETVDQIEVQNLSDIPTNSDGFERNQPIDMHHVDYDTNMSIKVKSDQSRNIEQIEKDSSEHSEISASYNVHETNTVDNAIISEPIFKSQVGDPTLLKYNKVADNVVQPVKRLKMIESNFEPLMQSDRIIPSSRVSRPILPDHNMYLSSDEGKTYASLMQQGSDMLATRPVFMAHACHVCKQLHSKHYRLKSCGNCRLVAYCSPQHQRAHWPLHRDFCKIVTKYARRMGVEHIYEDAHNVINEDKWKEIKYNHMNKCEELLGRPLETNEKEMFLFPRTCQTCHETHSENLRTCADCHSVSFCCQQHLRPNHNKYCKNLRLLVEINRYQNKHGICNPPLPEKILENYEQLPSDIRELLTVRMFGPRRAHQLGNVELAVLSDHASYPLTLLYAMQNGANIGDGPPLADRQSLLVHVVGAESGIECDNIVKWDAFLLRLLPALRTLHIIFLGLGLEACGNSGTLATSEYTSDICQRAGKQMICQFQPHTAYHDFCRGPEYCRPDIVCAFNAGLHRFAGHESRDHWRQSLEYLVGQQVPLVITGFSLFDVQQDVARVKEVQQVQKQECSVLIPPIKNPYGSKRPLMNYLKDHDDPLVYRNQYVACIMANSSQN